MIDTKNTSQEYWDSILKGYGLDMDRGRKPQLWYVGIMFEVDLPRSAECLDLPWIYTKRLEGTDALIGPHIEKQNLISDIYDTIKTLGKEEQKVIQAIYVHGLTEEETANKLHLSKRTVQRRKNRAISSLIVHYLG